MNEILPARRAGLQHQDAGTGRLHGRTRHFCALERITASDQSTLDVHVPEEFDVKALRRKLGMSQSRFAASFGFGLDAVPSWEQGRRRPEGAARVLLKSASPD